MVGVSKQNISNPEFKIFVHDLINQWAQELADENADLIGISVFSYYSQYFTRELALAIKKLQPTANIIIGGAGITDSITTGPIFGQELKDQGVITDYIHGDAEIAWPMLLGEFFNIKIDKSSISTDNYLNINYLPDYSDYNISRYNPYRTTEGLLWLPITGSRGCVRNCSFCEIPGTWKFVQRNAKNIANEIRSALAVADNLYFHFTDSLTNGSLSTFNELLDELIELQKIKPFRWGGQYIIRQGRVEDWEKISASGADILEIGLETGSDSLRFEMDKRFYNNDVGYALDQMEKHRIRAVLLMFCGYPTETPEQFTETLNFFTKIKQYAKTSVRAVQLNFSFCVFENTPLYNNRKAIQLHTTSDPAQWHCKTNPTLTLQERIRRRLITQEHLESLDFVLGKNTRQALEELVLNYIKGNQGKQYTFDQMATEVLGRETTIKYRFPKVDR